MTRLRFCMLTTFYPPFSFGGDAIAVQRLSHALAGRGHHVSVIHDTDAFHLLNSGAVPPPEPAPAGMEVHALSSSLGAVSHLLTHQSGRPVVHSRRIRQLIEEGDFDVINFHNISLVGGPGLLALGSGVKLYMAHEHWLVCPTHVLWRHQKERCDHRECFRCVLHYRRPPQLWRHTGLLGRQLHHVDVFIAMSEFSRRKHREFGFPREMEVLPYFLPDLSPTNESPGSLSPRQRPYFLFAGRLEQIKGLDDVIPVFRGLQGADLVIAGDGDHGDRLRERARGMDNVHFLGRIPSDHLAQYLQNALALIVPSVCFETFGIVLIEAFREGTPVIARRVGPLPEIVHTAQAGELFDTAEDLKSVIRRFLGDSSHRRQLGEAGRKAFHTHWSESVVVPRYLDIVRTVAEKRGDLKLLEKMRSTD